MATTPGGLPYPVGTDHVVDGDDAIRLLAQAIDPRLPKAGAWTSYTPAWNAGSGQPSVGTGALGGRYYRHNNYVSVTLTITIGTGASGGTSGGWVWSLPTPVLASGHAFAVAGWIISAAGVYLPVAARIQGDQWIRDAVDGKGVVLAVGYPLAQGAVLILSATYESTT